MTDLLKTISAFPNDAVINQIISICDRIKEEFQSLKGTYDAIWLIVKGTTIH